MPATLDVAHSTIGYVPIGNVPTPICRRPPRRLLGVCDLADDDAMADILAEHIAGFEPDAVVTFGPEGMTGHPDHRAVSRWTSRAVASTPTAELLYAALTDDQADRHRELHERIGLFEDLEGGRPASIPRRRVALQCTLDEVELTRKRQALARHGSQTDALAAMIGEETYFSWWREESFRHPVGCERGAVSLAGGRP
jgi:LmbE family N-acetylglucosaminyl deacetylase